MEKKGGSVCSRTFFYVYCVVRLKDTRLLVLLLVNCCNLIIIAVFLKSHSPLHSSSSCGIQKVSMSRVIPYCHDDIPSNVASTKQSC